MRRTSSCPPTFVLLSMLAGWACSDATAPAQAGLDRGRELWQQAAILNYRITIERRCFCPGTGIPVVVDVTDGSIASITDAATGDTVDVSQVGTFPTINGLFAVIQDAVDRVAHDINVTYETDLGYPLVIEINYERDVQDEELGYITSGFVRQ